MNTFRPAHSGTVAFFLVMVSLSVALSQTPDAATKFRMAQGFERSGDYERAVTIYEELARKDPANYTYVDALQRILVLLKRYDAAIEVVRKRLTNAPADINLQALLGSIYYRAGREDEATAEWERVLAGVPANPLRYRVTANVMLENRLLERAAEVYRRGRDSCGDPNLFTLERAQLLSLSMDYAGSTAEYVRWLRQNPTQVGFVENRIALFTWKDEGRRTAVEVVRDEAQKDDASYLYELLGWLHLEGKQFDEAFDVYRRIDELTRGNGVALYTFADRALKEQAYTVAAAAYQEALNAPLPGAKVPYARYGYACALKEMGALADTVQPLISGARPATESRPDYGGAIVSFRQLINDYPRTEFSAKSYYQIGCIQLETYADLDGALASFQHVLEEVPGENPIRCQVLLRIGGVFLIRGDTVAAVDRYRRVAGALRATPDQSDEASYRLAEISYYHGDFEAALRRLDSLTFNLKADYANDALQRRSFLQENIAVARQPLTEFARAEFLSAQRKYVEAAALLITIVDRWAQSPLADDALMKAASLQAQAGQYRDAIAIYERLLSQFKDNSVLLDRARFGIGEVYQFGFRDAVRASAAYQQVLAEHPKSVLVEAARKRIRQLRGDAF